MSKRTTPTTRPLRISVFGTGYLGATHAVATAEAQNCWVTVESTPASLRVSRL